MVFVPRMDVDQGRLAMQVLLAGRATAPDAVICANDLLAIGAMQACRVAGLHCPGDISITGYNDIPLLDMLDPPLASVAMDLPKIGERAAAMLLAHLADPTMPGRLETITPQLRLRTSLGRRGAPGGELTPDTIG
jgi:LacI family transcriptional regulator